MSGGKFGNEKFDANQEFSKSDNSALLCCPNCPDQGWWVGHNTYTGEPEQVQCEFCYTEPKSVFNNRENKAT